MASEREYLVSLGLATPGRGRFSAKAKQALEKARRDGMTFDETVKPTPRSDSGSNRKSRPITSPSSGVMELRSRTLAQDAKIVYVNPSSGKRQIVSDRNVCGTCGVSLSHHMCNNPTALVRGVSGFVPVTIE